MVALAVEVKAAATIILATSSEWELFCLMRKLTMVAMITRVEMTDGTTVVMIAETTVEMITALRVDLKAMVDVRRAMAEVKGAIMVDQVVDKEAMDGMMTMIDPVEAMVVGTGVTMTALNATMITTDGSTREATKEETAMDVMTIVMEAQASLKVDTVNRASHTRVLSPVKSLLPTTPLHLPATTVPTDLSSPEEAMVVDQTPKTRS